MTIHNSAIGLRNQLRRHYPPPIDEAAAQGLRLGLELPTSCPPSAVGYSSSD